ncbi:MULTISPECIES: hypothetical protein [Bacillus]|uniref:hypothetical protein n=1 Tax=Bacillus TaxID=1386 RepID=UPI000BF80074|nr:MULTISPECIES: hypothetical protein [Bacillus cereus group]NIE92129.1 hypothetical protein [Bacillus sp. Ab-1751]MBJ7963038.1 hypothetical protein [Bacillus cereus]MBJ7998431.1 hypothetical protein [Bacillus cereus]PFF61833.1 hypothetical protein CN358_16955 [Bacillus thuringiensis]PFJ10451.1 hypothetical protein COI87_17835 [Bacillus thuringiensis]
MNKCPVCLTEESSQRQIGRELEVNCNNCGCFIVTSNSYYSIKDHRIQLCAVLRERKLNGLDKIAIFAEKPNEIPDHIPYPILTMSELLAEFPEKVSEKIDRALCNIAKLSDYPGAKVHIYDVDFGVLFVNSGKYEEMLFLLEQLRADEYIEGYIEGYPAELALTVKGWNRVAELERESIQESQDAFVAMWFNEEVNGVYDEAISTAIKEAGYNPIRIDKVNHNNKICDEIIAKIKRSRFIIADFTGGRGGVYFEAGYAMGLGKPVIWTCRRDHLENLHFDTRQYSHIVWETKEDLREQLLNRIMATIN